MHDIFSMTMIYCFTELIDKFPDIFSLIKSYFPPSTHDYLTSRPEGLSSRTSSRFLSTYSKTRCNLPFLMNFISPSTENPYRLKASLSCTMLSCLNIRSNFTSRRMLFLTKSSSSDSLNFLIATT